MPLYKHLIVPGSILMCIKWPNCPKLSRPVLVLSKHTDPITETVIVAYGTGQRTNEKNGRNSPTNIEISSKDCQQYNLLESTRFDLKNVFIFDLNDDNFSQCLSKLKKPLYDEMINIYTNLKPYYRSLSN